MKELISSLNQEIYEKHGEEEIGFSYSTNGYVDIIFFGEYQLWSSEMDDREWIEENNDYEPIEPYIKKLFNAYADKLFSLKFN